jgi:hypothetical protein
MMESYRTMATYAAPYGAVKSMPHFNSKIDDIKLCMLICKENCDYFWKQGQRHRRQHLTNCLEAAQEREDDIAEQNILAIIKHKKNKAFWRRLNYAIGKHIHGQSVQTVQVEDGAGGCWTSTPRRQCRRQSSTKFTASNIT